MKIGVYYYPEQWPREQWERDFDNIASMGLQIVHMAEFAWMSLEPSPGEFRFDWLSECVELARHRSLDVILCTPTAAPPIWLSEKGVLPEDVHGTLARFGGRRHYSPVSHKFRDATRRIVTALADRFADHPSVIGWQIDNEYSGSFDQSAEAQAAFRTWLRRKYGSIDRLNAAWGCQFWNSQYTSFDQVMLPPTRDPGYANPHQHLEASRFWSWAFADFNKLQAEILKPRVGKRFITTNFMPLHPDLNPADCVGDIDFYSWNTYPVTGWDKNVKDETFRMADPSSMALVHEHMRSFTGRWSLMEIQPGQINWSGFPVHLYPGAVRLWLWTVFAHGAEFVTTYRFRQPRFGTEMWHHALVGHDGVTPTYGGREFMQTIEEMATIRPKLAASTGKPRRSATERVVHSFSILNEKSAGGDGSQRPVVALLLDFEQQWMFTTLPQAKKFSWGTLQYEWYSALASIGLDVRVIRPDSKWSSSIQIIAAPAVQMIDDALVARLEQFVESGGDLVLTPRSGLVDRTGQFFECPYAGKLHKLLGTSIRGYDVLPEDTLGTVEFAGKSYRWNTWADLLDDSKAVRVLGRYTDQFYSGTSAIVQHQLGKGRTTYCGTIAEAALSRDVVRHVAKARNLEVLELPPRVQVARRDGLVVCMNYRDEEIAVPAPEGTKFLVGGAKIGPAEVAVWEDEARS